MLDVEESYLDWDSLNKRKLKVDPLNLLFLHSSYFVQCYIVSEFEKSSSPCKYNVNDIENSLSDSEGRYHIVPSYNYYISKQSKT
jgi:hypothetical protein